VNFGKKKTNRNTLIVDSDAIEKTNEQLSYDRQKNSEYNKAKYEIKASKVKKKGKKKRVEYSTTSETLWREINMFWLETIAIVGAGIAGIILMFVVRFMSATGLEMIREMLTDQAYIEVAGLIQNVNTLFMGIAAIPFLVLIGFYAYRMFVFTPRKDRQLVARVKSTGAIRFSVENIGKQEIQFGKGVSNNMTITNPKKHWVENTGKPIVVLFEGDDSNADLNVLAGRVSGKSKEINTVNDNAVSWGRRLEKYLQEEGKNFLTTTNILLIVILGVIGVVAFLVLKNPETTAGLLGGASGLVFQKKKLEGFGNGA